MTATDQDPRRVPALGRLVGEWLAQRRALEDGEDSGGFAAITEEVVRRMAREIVRPQLLRHGLLGRGEVSPEEVALDWIEDCLLPYAPAFERATAADDAPEVAPVRLAGLLHRSIRQHVTRLHAAVERDSAVLHRSLRRTLGRMCVDGFGLRVWLPEELAAERTRRGRPGVALRQIEFRSARLIGARIVADPVSLLSADEFRVRFERVVGYAERRGIEADPARLATALRGALAGADAAVQAPDLYQALQAGRPRSHRVELDPDLLVAPRIARRDGDDARQSAPRLAALVRAARGHDRDPRLGPLWRDAAALVVEGRSLARARRLRAFVAALCEAVEAELSRRDAFSRDLPLAAAMCEVLRALEAKWPDENGLERLYRRRRWNAGRSQRAEDRLLVERVLRDLLGLPGDSSDGHWLPRAS